LTKRVNPNVELAIQACVFLVMVIVLLCRPEFAAYGLVLFLTQIPLVLGGVLAAKKLFGRVPDAL
jgi:hypothetical protein